MKTILTSILLLVAAHYATAQSCKIKIYYDANGNRTQRILECGPGGHGPGRTQSIVSTQRNLFNDVAAGTYQVYPNPAENKVNVKLNADLLAKGCQIAMTDLSGRVIAQHTAVPEVSVFDLQGLADGTYFIIITAGNERHTVKIIKQTGNGYY